MRRLGVSLLETNATYQFMVISRYDRQSCIRGIPNTRSWYLDMIVQEKHLVMDFKRKAKYFYKGDRVKRCDKPCSEFMRNARQIGDGTNNDLSIRIGYSYTPPLDQSILARAYNIANPNYKVTLETNWLASVLDRLLINPALALVLNEFPRDEIPSSLPEGWENATNPKDILGLTKGEWSYLKSFDDPMRFLTRHLYPMKEYIDMGIINLEVVKSVIDTFRDSDLLNVVRLLELGYTWSGIRDYVQRIGPQQNIYSAGVLLLLKDYAKMSQDMNVDYERYPRSLKLAHDTVARDYKVVQDERAMMKYTNIISGYKDLEYTYNDGRHRFVIPETIEELSSTGRKMRNCVGSYLTSIMNEESKIVSLVFEDQPIATIEVSPNNEVIQAMESCNRTPSPEVRDMIRTWAKDKNLIIRID